MLELAIGLSDADRTRAIAEGRVTIERMNARARMLRCSHCSTSN